MGKSSKTRRPYGSGSVRSLGDGKWRIEAVDGRRSDGARRRMSRVVRGTRADAERELVALRVEMGASPNVGDGMTLGEYYAEVWLPGRGRMLARNTVESYQTAWRCHIGPAFGHRDAASIGRAEVQRWVAGLPTAATAERCLRYLRAILRCMWNDDLLDEKPLERQVKLPRHQVSPTGVWTPDELWEALGRLRGHRLEALALAMAGGGLRREEALAIDLPGDVVSSTVTGDDGTGHVVLRLLSDKSWTVNAEQADVTKTYRVRPVSIGEPFSVRLMSLMSDGRPKLAMRLDGRGPLKPSSISETWRRCFAEGSCLHGMRYVEIRSLRHCHETIASRSGLPDAMVSDLHGHSERVMYSHYLSLMSEDADAMAEAVRRQMERAASCGLEGVRKAPEGPDSRDWLRETAGGRGYYFR